MLIMTTIDICNSIRNYKKVIQPERNGDTIIGVALKWKEVQKVKKYTEEALHKIIKTTIN